MAPDNVQLLKRLFSGVSGQTAFDKLSSSLEKLTDVQMIPEENEFLMQAARVFGERQLSDSKIDGSEDSAHRVLRHILIEHANNGQSGLRNLKNTYSMP